MRDQRYETIQALLKLGKIENFNDIFNYIPFSVIANDLHTNRPRMKKMIANPLLWQLAEIYQLAEFIGYDRKKLGLMVIDQVEKMRKG